MFRLLTTALLLGGICFSSSSVQAGSPEHWEYKVWVYSSSEYDESVLGAYQGRLNQWGSQGWELVSRTQDGLHVFKRPLTELAPSPGKEPDDAAAFPQAPPSLEPAPTRLDPGSGENLSPPGDFTPAELEPAPTRPDPPENNNPPAPIRPDPSQPEEPVPSPQPPAESSPSPQPPKVSAEAMLKLFNQVRQKDNKSPLKIDAKLNAAAQKFAEYVYRTQKFSHYADGRSPAERMAEQGYRGSSWAENLCVGAAAAAETYDVWMKSPPHKENILSKHQDVGFGLAGDVWVAVFGQPAE